MPSPCRIRRLLLPRNHVNRERRILGCFETPFRSRYHALRAENLSGHVANSKYASPLWRPLKQWHRSSSDGSIMASSLLVLCSSPFPQRYYICLDCPVCYTPSGGWWFFLHSLFL